MRIDAIEKRRSKEFSTTVHRLHTIHKLADLCVIFANLRAFNRLNLSFKVYLKYLHKRMPPHEFKKAPPLHKETA